MIQITETGDISLLCPSPNKTPSTMDRKPNPVCSHTTPPRTGEGTGVSKEQSQWASQSCVVQSLNDTTLKPRGWRNIQVTKSADTHSSHKPTGKVDFLYHNNIHSKI